MLDLLAEDRIQFTVEQHLHDLLSRRRASGVIFEFGDVGIFKRDPVDRVEIDAIVIGENAAQPGAGRGA